MEKTRVPKGEKYWYLVFFGGEVLIYSMVERNFADDNEHFAMGNYFHTQEEAEAMARKLRAVLAGADVVVMLSEEEIEIEANKIAEEITGGPMSGCIRIAVKMAAKRLQSKIIK